jgi:predicted  nucleic acid-binding Zn-ribbon protein
MMLFVCRTCGRELNDIDAVLDGTCDCGGTHFKLVSQDRPQMPTAMTTKEEIRRDLHRWIDLNIDTMDPDVVEDIRVTFEIPTKK